VLDAHRRINSIRRGLVNLAKQNDSDFINKLERVRKYIKQQVDISKGINVATDELIKLNQEDVLAYGLLDNLDFVTMATTDEKFREDLYNLSSQSNQKGSILDKL